MSEYWFRRKRYGYGANPSHWKGWAALGAFIAIELVLVLLLIVWPATSAQGLGATDIVIFVVAVLLLSAGFMRLVWLKTEGGWGWQWGDRRDRRP